MGAGRVATREATDAAGAATALGTVPVMAGAATVSLAVPAGAAEGTGTLALTAAESGTVVKADVKVAASGPVPPVCKAPVPPAKWYDALGWIAAGVLGLIAIVLIGLRRYRKAIVQ